MELVAEVNNYPLGVLSDRIQYMELVAEVNNYLWMSLATEYGTYD